MLFLIEKWGGKWGFWRLSLGGDLYSRVVLEEVMGCCVCVGGVMWCCVGLGFMEMGEMGGGKLEMVGEWLGLFDLMLEGWDGWFWGWEIMFMIWFWVGLWRLGLLFWLG